ncbi:MAG: TonB-dependent receptor [Paramuribaculum sp.]|nr:TonB-dependent receptor [Paramuribaculum sp.]
MKRIILTALLLISLSLSAAAASYAITGRVVDDEGEPEAFATLRLFNASDTAKAVTTGVTTDDGIVKLTVATTGEYILRISSVGRTDIRKEISVSSPVTDLGTLIITTNENLLSEVTVTAARPLVSKEIDRIGYDVQADEESRTSTLDETLRKVPLVSVDDDGTIKVKGSSNFKIYRNGKPNNSFTNNAKDIFKAIPASMIKKIEVITEPGAREDAEGVGAILNIVTMEAVSMKGVMGNVGIEASRRNEIPGANLWLSSQINKVTFSAYGGYNRIAKGASRQRSVSEGTYEGTGNMLRSESNSHSSGWVNYFGLDGSYELDSLNLFTAEFGGFSYTVNSFQSGVNSLLAYGSPIYSYTSTSRINPMSYLDFNGGLNYQRSTRRKGEQITLSYLISTTNQRNNSETEYTDAVNMPVPYDGILSDFRLKFLEQTAQADWSRVYADIHTLDLGLKYIHRRNRSRTNQDYLGINDIRYINFTHTTQVAAAYADYRLSLGRFGFRAGLRYEYSRLSAKYADGSEPSFSSNLNDWVPNAAVSYSINDANTLKLSYGTRIARPGIDYLNPAVNESPNSTSQGNPRLESGRNTSLSLNYNLIGRKVNLDFSAGYSFNNNDVVEVMTVRDDHTYSSYANAGHNKSVNLGLYFQWTVTSKTNFMLNADATYEHFANPSLNITNGGWSAFFFANLTQRLPWKLRAQGSVMYWYGSTQGLYYNFRSLGNVNYKLSLQRSFLKEDRLTVNLYVRNPFHSKHPRFRSSTVNSDFRNASYTFRHQITDFGISISYRFGSLNAQVKKTAKTIQNDDLSGRHSGGGGGAGQDSGSGM